MPCTVCGFSPKEKWNKIRDNCSIIRACVLCCCCLAVIIVCGCSYLIYTSHWRDSAKICAYQLFARWENKIYVLILEPSCTSLRCGPIHGAIFTHLRFCDKKKCIFLCHLDRSHAIFPLQISFRLNGYPICSNGFAGAILPIKSSNDFLYQDNR